MKIRIWLGMNGVKAWKEYNWVYSDKYEDLELSNLPEPALSTEADIPLQSQKTTICLLEDSVINSLT